MSADTPAQFGWKRAAGLGLSFRPIVDDDEVLFAGRVYASVRKELLADLPWSDAQKAAFLLLQFRAEQAFYRQEYPEADWLVISGGDIDIGRLYLDCEPEDEHRIIDLALLPPYRGRGAGAALLRDLMDEAASAGKALSGEVGKESRAMRLFSRLGFVVAEDRGERNLMRWTA
jgi:GNAT superfamily N-acetyltransferase